MKVQIAYHGLDSTPAIDTVIRDKTKKLKKFFDGQFDVNWTCKTDNEGHHSHAQVIARGFKLNAYDTDDDLYKTVDHVVSKIDRQLRKKKDIAKDHIHRRNVTIKEQLNET